MSGERLRITISGAVQGVGFRPHVHRLAGALALSGFVRNRGADVQIEAEGECVAALLSALHSTPPAHASIERIACERVAPLGDKDFSIAPSVVEEAGAVPPRVLPDLACCAECLRELFDPANRHYRYPFTNCSHCGPRYSILCDLPYDRANTTLAPFALCAACQTEYDDPHGRRFHAQPTACATCGPRLTLRDADGRALATQDAALRAAAQLTGDGRVLALKGLGGYQLVVDAGNEAAVARLRMRKQRHDKPFAIMVRDLAEARRYCRVGAAQAALLASAAAPIVVLERAGDSLAASVAPGLRTLGVMLPTTPLHHLLLAELGGAVVCTSGNRGEEPICIDDADALAQLKGIADAWLGHDRAIRRALDDSVARIIDGAPQVLRAGRGYAPVVLPYPAARPALACGGHLSNTVAVAGGGRAIVSQHLGDLEHARCLDAMHIAADDLRALHHIKAPFAAVDLHPDYASDAAGPGGALPRRRVQHHLAHALAVMLEHALDGPVLAVVWDGSGLGSDGKLWGSEFLIVERRAGVTWRRFLALREFSLPGGDAAARDPLRALSGLRWEVDGLRARVPAAHREVLTRAVNTPRTTSAGRLFDGVAALLGFDARQSYSGQAATRLEHVAGGIGGTPYPLPRANDCLDWGPLLCAIEQDYAAGVAVENISARFHASLACAITDVARSSGLTTIILTGGCFQNRLLTELTVARVRAVGLQALLARRLPPHDGGLAAGQLVAAIEGVTGHVPGRTGTH